MDRNETNGRPVGVAIKRFRDSVDPSSIEMEMAVLARVSSIHIVKLIDLATDPVLSRPCLILQRLALPSLARLFADRLTIAPGEAVTILAPIASAIAELHHAGVCHGNICAGNVLFDKSAAPVLVGFGAAYAWAGLAPGDDGSLPAHSPRAPGVVHDLKQLAAMATAVLEQTHAASGHNVTALARWLSTTDPQSVDQFAGQLVDQLFDLAPALPLGFVRGRGIGDVATSIRAGFRPPVVGPKVDDAEQLNHVQVNWAATVSAGPDVKLRRRFDGLMDHVPVQARMLIGLAYSSLRQAGALLVRTVRGLPKPARFAAGLSTLLLIIVVVASGAMRDQPESAPSPGSATLADARTESAIRGGPVRGSSADPLDAAKALFAARAECLQAFSVRCLEGVEQPGSGALVADTASIAASRKGGTASAELELSAESFQLIDRMGDSALISATVIGSTVIGAMPPAVTDASQATVLLIKTHDGWRIRDIVWMAN